MLFKTKLTEHKLVRHRNNAEGLGGFLNVKMFTGHYSGRFGILKFFFYPTFCKVILILPEKIFTQILPCFFMQLTSVKFFNFSLFKVLTHKFHNYRFAHLFLKTLFHKNFFRLSNYDVLEFFIVGETFEGYLLNSRNLVVNLGLIHTFLFFLPVGFYFVDKSTDISLKFKLFGSDLSSLNYLFQQLQKLGHINPYSGFGIFKNSMGPRGGLRLSKKILKKKKITTKA